MTRCDHCYGDARGECIRAGFCIFGIVKREGPMTRILTTIRNALRWIASPFAGWSTLPCDECNRLGHRCDCCRDGIGLL